MSTPRLRIRFYPNDDASEVKDFLNKLYRDPQRRAASLRLEADIRVLAHFWPDTMNVTIRMMGGWEPLRELKRRCGPISSRIFFAVLGSDLWLLSAFEKQSKGTPSRELRKAYDRLRILQREAA